jgi:glycosyltransferase involved in cell wall biosynthesis
LLFDLQGSLTTEMQAHELISGKGLYYKFWHFVEKVIDHLPDVVVTQATQMAEELKGKFGVSPDRVFLTLDGVDTEDFRPDLEVSNLRAKLNLPEGKKIAVYLGLLTEYQGVDCMVESIPNVIAQYPGVHFLIMGYPDEERYQKMAERLGVREHTTFTGAIDYKEAPRYICLGDVALSPKLSETEANGKLYNYMACGLPTVAFDTWVNREILGNLGVYAKLGDPPSLAEAIVKALTNEEWAGELGRKARERVVAEFSWDNVARRLMRCYAQALARDRGIVATTAGQLQKED